MFKKSILTALLVTVTALAAHAAPTKIDAKIAKYKPASGVAGNLGSIGSDTLNNLMTYWAEGFKKKYPNVNIQTPPALIAGTSQLGPMSREMKPTEIEQFEKKYGYKPTKIGVALDSLAVYVNKDNPIKSLSLDEVDAIFSKTRKRGVAEITTWGQLGVTGKLAAMPISLYGRNSASGTYGYFKEHTLKGGDYKNSVKEQPGSASVVEGVAHDIAGIGYSGIGQPLPKVVEEFLKFALSKEGQEIVVKDGYDPLTAKMVETQLKALK